VFVWVKNKVDSWSLRQERKLVLYSKVVNDGLCRRPSERVTKHGPSCRRSLLRLLALLFLFLLRFEDIRKRP
jgi:hypothetical protein